MSDSNTPSLEAQKAKDTAGKKSKDDGEGENSVSKVAAAAAAASAAAANSSNQNNNLSSTKTVSKAPFAAGYTATAAANDNTNTLKPPPTATAPAASSPSSSYSSAKPPPASSTPTATVKSLKNTLKLANIATAANKPSKSPPPPKRQFRILSNDLDRVWMFQYNRLKEFQAEHQHLHVGQHLHLYDWMQEQHVDYSKFLDIVEGKGHANTLFNEQKLLRLRELGFVLERRPHKPRKLENFEAKIKLLKEYRDQYRTIDVAAGNKEEKYKGLYHWMTGIRLMLRQKQSASSSNEVESSDDFYTPERLARLDDLGIRPEPNRERKRKQEANKDSSSTKKKRKNPAKPESDESWEANFEKMKSFVQEHGHSIVPTTKGPHSQLRNWLERQRQEYRKLQDANEPSQLTASRLQKLNSIQFAFDARKQYTWEERFQQWCAYRVANNGKDPPQASGALGKWISKMRASYQAKQKGEKTNLTQEQIDRMNARGFIWRVMKVHDQPANKKAWEERFQELVEYKREHGTTCVPQQQRGLGAWVHKQRTYYSMHVRGIPNDRVNFGADKIEKLNSIGFTWSVRDGRAARPAAAKRGNDDSDSDDDEDSDEDENDNSNNDSSPPQYPRQHYFHQPHPQNRRWRL